ncbi:MAG: hypothetical protein BWX58_01138 [Deltaproteobacteria bacterium ADurb.Bin026]|nr:MAG: hypothetical protein BWX58_01138 [Deltaproteobacteria bacterium ADurb.Bin026]
MAFKNGNNTYEKQKYGGIIVRDKIYEAIIEKLPCTCDAAYKDRGLVAPDCPRCIFAWEITDSVCELLNIQYDEITELRGEIAELKKELALNASMLARQCNLAREAEAKEMKSQKEIERLKQELSSTERCWKKEF